MAPLKVELMFDFGSPNAYLAELVLPEIEEHTGVKFDHVPVLLGGIYKFTNNRSSADYLRGIKNEPEFTELERGRFLRRHNSFGKNPFFRVNTLHCAARSLRSLGAYSIRTLVPPTTTCGKSRRRWTTGESCKKPLPHAISTTMGSPEAPYSLTSTTASLN